MLNYSLGLTATDWKNVESRSQHSAPYMVPEQSTGRENKSSTWPALSGNENTAPPHLLSTMVDKVMPVDLSVLKPNGSWDSGWAKKCQTEHWAANPRLCSGLWEVPIKQCSWHWSRTRPCYHFSSKLHSSTGPESSSCLVFRVSNLRQIVHQGFTV